MDGEDGIRGTCFWTLAYPCIPYGINAFAKHILVTLWHDVPPALTLGGKRRGMKKRYKGDVFPPLTLFVSFYEIYLWHADEHFHGGASSNCL